MGSTLHEDSRVPSEAPRRVNVASGHSGPLDRTRSLAVLPRGPSLMSTQLEPIRAPSPRYEVLFLLSIPYSVLLVLSETGKSVTEE